MRPVVRQLMARLPPLPTAVVGSTVQPDWLVDRRALSRRAPPRIRADDLWRVAPMCLCQAQDDATLLAIRAQQKFGFDIVGDGEVRRESYSCTFASALQGIDVRTPGHATDRRGNTAEVPRAVAPVRWCAPVFAHDTRVLLRHAQQPTKMTLPGPFTLTQLTQDDFYGDPRRLAIAYAEAVNAEIRCLHAAGVDIVQLDEPYLEARPEAAAAYGIEAIDRAITGLPGATALHICFGYGPIDRGYQKPNRYRFLAELDHSGIDILSIEAAQPNLELDALRDLPSKILMLGVLDLGTNGVDPVTVVEERILRALGFVSPERLIPAPDCGLKYLSATAAAGKMHSLAAAARAVRLRLTE